MLLLLLVGIWIASGSGHPGTGRAKALALRGEARTTALRGEARTTALRGDAR